MPLLTHSHLAVIRAALKYWDEEMSPHDPAIYQGYFVEPIGTGEWIPPAVSFLRSQFSACELRYALCSPDKATILGSQLFQALDEAQNAALSSPADIATVLIFPSGG
jgi:hypothetical protein